MKRTYILNQSIWVDKDLLTVTSGGTVYLVKNKTQEKLDSIYLPLTKKLVVSINDKKTVELNLTSSGLVKGRVYEVRLP